MHNSTARGGPIESGKYLRDSVKPPSPSRGLTYPLNRLR